jgi:hypothetical protein
MALLATIVALSLLPPPPSVALHGCQRLILALGLGLLALLRCASIALAASRSASSEIWSMRMSGSMEVVGDRTRAAVSNPEANFDISSRSDLIIADWYSLSAIVMPTAASSSRFTHINPRNDLTSPPCGQCISKNVVSISASAY